MWDQNNAGPQALRLHPEGQHNCREHSRELTDVDWDTALRYTHQGGAGGGAPGTACLALLRTLVRVTTTNTHTLKY